jgi:AraC-like DNA-binding protein
MSDMRGSLDLREEPPGGRMARWNEALSDAFAAKTCRALAEGPYEARMRWRSWASGLTVAQIHAAPAYIEHPLTHGSGARGRDFLIHFQLEGTTLNCQDGRDAFLSPGDFTLCDTGRPYAIRFEAPARVLVFRLPSERVERVMPDAEELVATRIAGDRGGGALFSAFAMRLVGQFEDEAIAGAADDLPDAILSLVALARPPASGERPGAAANPLLWRRVTAFVQAHLTDEALGVSAIAAHCGVSTRYIQKVFATCGFTPTSYILQRRLRLAAMQLRDGRNGEKGVLDIALSAGFRDLSYFNRAFRSKFGATPSQFRRSL